MNVERAPAARPKHLQISRRLERFHLAEGVSLPGNREVLPVVGRDLEKNTFVRAALVELTGRVEKARAVTERGRDSLLVPDAEAQCLESGIVLAGHRDESVDGEIVPRPKRREQLPQAASGGPRGKLS